LCDSIFLKGTNMSKYEQLIEYIINENEAKARELFHQIVVEKSREIYESLIDEEDLAEVGGNEVEQMVDEITGDEQGMSEDEEMDVEMDSEEEEDGMDMGDNMGGEEELEDRVMDLEDALDELKAEFDALMADESDADMGGEEDMGMDMGMGDEGSEEEDMMEDEEDDEEDDEEMDESVQESKSGRKMTEAEWIREYVEKIGEYPGEQKSPTGKMAGTGAQSEQQGERNTKSPVAGKNDMGGKVVGGSPDETVPTGPKNPSNAYTKGQGTINSGNKNVPGGNAAKIGKAPAAKKGEEGGINKKSIES
jgi:hypothetical protein